MSPPSSVIVSRCHKCHTNWPVDHGKLCRICSTETARLSDKSEVAAAAGEQIQSIDRMEYYENQQKEDGVQSNGAVSIPTNDCAPLGLGEQVNMTPVGEYLRSMTTGTVLALSALSLSGNSSGIVSPASTIAPSTPIVFPPTQIIHEASRTRKPSNICENVHCRAALNRTKRCVHPKSGLDVCRPCLKYFLKNGSDRTHKSGNSFYDGRGRKRMPSRICSNSNCSVVLYQTTGYAHPISGNCICRPCYMYFRKHRTDRTQRTTKAAFERFQRQALTNLENDDDYPKCQNGQCNKKLGRNSTTRCSVCLNYLLTHKRERPEYLILSAVRRKEALDLTIRVKYIHTVLTERGFVMNAEHISHGESGTSNAMGIEMSSEQHIAQNGPENSSISMKLKTLLTQ